MIPRPQPSTIIRPSFDNPAGLPSPADWGIPGDFSSWRSYQWEAVNRIIDMKERFIVLCLPTGSGKSLTGVAAAILSSRKTVILTSTKGLQDQYTGSFPDGVHDVRGMGNYLCPIAGDMGLSSFTSVSEAPCQCGFRCPVKSTCEYFARYRDAKRLPIVTTNYQCWMYDSMKGKEAIHTAPWEKDANANGNGMAADPSVPSGAPVAMLICDEATEAPEELSRYIGMQISQRECLQLAIEWPGDNLTLDQWREWAAWKKKDLAGRLAYWEDQFKTGSRSRGWSREFKLVKDLVRKVTRLAGIQASDNWIMDSVKEPGTDRVRAFKFSPLEPARYAEQALWRGVEKVVLMSATVRPKTAEMLGIKPDQMTFVEYPSTFPRQRRPIISVPSVMLNYRVEQDDRAMRKWLDRVDAVIEPRLGRKGVIHAVSYARAKFLRDNSRFGRYMFVHSSHDRAEVVSKFKDWQAPAILVSPSVDAGYDFPMDECRWIIVAKLPFASVSDKLVKARQELDKEYSNFLTAQTLVQMTGRGVRSESDACESLILDDAFANWFFRRARKFFPDWWVQAIVWADGPTPPMEIT